METCGIVPPPRSSDSTSCPYGIESLLKTTRPAITPVTAPVAPYTPYPVLRIAALHPFSSGCYTFADRRRSPGLAALPVSTQTTPTLTRTGLPVETGDIRWPADIFREIRSKTSPLNFSTSVKSPRKRVRKSIEANAPISDEEKSSIQSLDTKVTKSSDLKFGIDRILNIDEDCQFHEPSDDSSDEYSSDSVDSQIDVESQSPVILPQPIITTSLPSRFPLLPTAIFPPLFGPGMHPNILPGLQQAASRCCPLQRQLMVQHPAFRMNPCTPRSRGVACQPEYPVKGSSKCQH